MASDAMNRARELIKKRSADHKAKIFGLDQDLRTLGEALDYLDAEQAQADIEITRLMSRVARLEQMQEVIFKALGDVGERVCAVGERVSRGR